MTPVEVKALLASKGWTNVALAARWRCTTVWISKIINDGDRAPHYNDALAGLPKGPKSEPRKVTSKRAPRAAKAARSGPGYRYHGVITQGDVLAVDPYFGSICEEGEHGIVIQVVDDGTCERYRTVFPRGDVELLDATLIDQCFYTNGQVHEFAQGYTYLSDKQVVADAHAGRFQI